MRLLVILEVLFLDYLLTSQELLEQLEVIMELSLKILLLIIFVLKKGIEHQFSSPYVPQQNGVVERKNRTLVEMARTMLDEYQTPRRFWAEAISIACYVS